MEPLDIIVKVGRFKTTVLRFKRGNTVYKVTKQIGTRLERKGDNVLTYYNCLCEEQQLVCEIMLDHLADSWYLVQVENYD